MRNQDDELRDAGNGLRADTDTRSSLSLPNAQEVEATGRRRREASGENEGRGTEISVFDLLAAIVRRRVFVVSLPLLVASLTVAITLDRDRTYSSTASFAPRSNASAGVLPSLAMQLGVSAATGDPTQQPLFYEALLKSPTILRAAVLTHYRYQDVARVAHDETLVGLFNPPGATASVRREAAVDMLRGNMSTYTDGTTGVVRVTIKSTAPELSLAICQRLLELLNSFNLDRRMSQATAERDFTRSRLDRVRGELMAAEERLRNFGLRNRLYESDPSLSLEHDRLARDVSLKQGVYTALAQRLEQAEVDAVRDTPIINVIETPVIAARPDRRSLIFKTLLAIAVSLGVALLIAIAPVFVGRLAAEEPQAFGRFARERENALSGFRKRFRELARWNA